MLKHPKASAVMVKISLVEVLADITNMLTPNSTTPAGDTVILNPVSKDGSVLRETLIFLSSPIIKGERGPTESMAPIG